MVPSAIGVNGDTGPVGRYPPNGRYKCRDNNGRALSLRRHRRTTRLVGQTLGGPDIGWTSLLAGEPGSLVGTATALVGVVPRAGRQT
jgi:hypothetical protein